MTGKTVTFYEADLCNKDQLRGIMSRVVEESLSKGQVPISCFDLFQHKIDCVIHFGAFKSVSESFQNPLKYYTNNVVGSCNLTEVNNFITMILDSTCVVYMYLIISLFW